VWWRSSHACTFLCIPKIPKSWKSYFQFQVLLSSFENEGKHHYYYTNSSDLLVTLANWRLLSLDNIITDHDISHEAANIARSQLDTDQVHLQIRSDHSRCGSGRVVKSWPTLSNSGRSKKSFQCSINGLVIPRNMCSMTDRQFRSETAAATWAAQAKNRCCRCSFVIQCRLKN